MKFSSAEEHQAENFRKMLMAMVDDIRIILIKLADRLHNMRTLQHLSEERRFRIANETLEIYAPLAGRLGIGRIKSELEELCLKNLEPKAYGILAARVEAKRKWAQEFIASIRATLEKGLKENGIPAEVTGSTKSIYSIHQKMKRQRIELDQVYDFIALRIITDSVKNCYGTLGHHPQHLASRSGADQGFHRHAPTQRLPLACTRASSPTRAFRSRCRSGPKKCTGSPSRASRHTGSTKRANPSRRTTSRTSPGCGRSSSGSAR